MTGDESSRASARECLAHDKPLAWERGGADKPTMTGRWYCPDCQAAFVAALDSMTDDARGRS